MAAESHDIAEGVRRLILEHAPASWQAQDLEPGVAISGGGGLAFDSVRVVELVFACEERFGVRLPDEAIAGPLTVARLVELVARARRAGAGA